MNRFWNFVTAVMVCALCGFGVGGVCVAQEPTPADGAAAPLMTNGFEIKHIELTPTGCVTQYHFTIPNPDQAIVVQLAQSNDFAEVKKNFPRKTQSTYRYLLSETDSKPSTDPKIPHTLSFKITPYSPPAGGMPFECDMWIADQKSFVAKLKYTVKAVPNVEKETTVHASIMVSNNSPYLVSDASMHYTGGGVSIDQKALRLDKGEVSPPIVQPKPVPVTQPLAYYADAISFAEMDMPKPNVKTANGALQFPFGENWPKKFSTKGDIVFEHPVETGDIVTEENFSAQIANPTPYSLMGQPITITSTTEYLDLKTSMWPQIRYIEQVTYSVDTGLNFRVRTKVGRLLDANTPDVIRHTLNLYVHPEQGNADYLKSILDKLTALGQMGDDTPPLVTIKSLLTAVHPILDFQKNRVDQLEEAHANLVNNGASSEVMAISRAKFESAKRAAEALVESYNATVMSYPD